MGMRPINDPYGTPITIVDKLIGNAYEIVRLIAKKMPIIEYLASIMERMEIVTQQSDNILSLKIVESTKLISEAGNTILIPIPDGISPNDIHDSMVSFLGSNGTLYFYESGKITHVINAGFLVVTIDASLTSVVLGGLIKWNLVHKVLP